MDITVISTIDQAFDHLLEAAAKLNEAEQLATEAGQIQLAADARLLARAVDAEAAATNVAILRALRS